MHTLDNEAAVSWDLPSGMAAYPRPSQSPPNCSVTQTDVIDPYQSIDVDQLFVFAAFPTICMASGTEKARLF